MKNIITLCLAFILTISVNGQTRFTIVNMNDTHSNLTAGQGRKTDLTGMNAGIARAAYFIADAKKQDPNTIVLHAGDSFIGDLIFNKYFGAAELMLLGQLGLDAMTLGNHEFDLGAPNLLTIMDSLKGKIGYNFLSANAIIANPEVARLGDYVKPYITKTVGTVKIGILGLTTPAANVLSSCLPDVFLDTNFIQTAGTYIQQMKTQDKCNVIIVLSHLGLEYDALLASYLSGIDAIIGGHDHFAFPDVYYLSDVDGKNVPYFQTGGYYEYMGKMEFTYSTKGELKLYSYGLTKLDGNIPEVPMVKAAVDQLVADVESVFGKAYTQKVGECTSELDEFVEIGDATRNVSSSVGKLVTAAFKDYTKTDIALEPCGSTAQKLYKGPLAGIDLFRLVGYGMNTNNYLGFRICTMKMYGAAILAGLEVGASQFDYNDEFLIQCAGMSYKIDMTKPQFERVWDVKIGGVNIDPQAVYTVTTNEIVPKFLDMFQIPYSDLEIKTGVSEYQTLMQYIATNSNLYPELFANNVFVETILDVNDNPNQNVSSAYPNPSNGETTITALLDKPGNYTIKVVDTKGNLVFEKVENNLVSGTNSIQMNLKSLMNGDYFYSIGNGEKAFYGKINIMK